MSLFPEQDRFKGAAFSRCRKYRWTLWRIWDADLPACTFIGLNPSTADENVNDPTIRRCIGFAKDWGFGRLIMLNAYGYRATDPNVMKQQVDPVGSENTVNIETVCKLTVANGGMVIAAWGVHCEPARQKTILETIAREVHCLGTTKAGMPKHPLYIKSDTLPKLFWSPAA